MTITVQQSHEKPAIDVVLRRGLMAAAVATCVNALLFLVGSTFIFPPQALTPMGQPVTIVQVVAMTLLAGVAAAIGYTLLTRFMAPTTASRMMWIGAVVILVGMFFSPFAIEDVPAAQIVILEIMHLVAGLVPIIVLTRR